MHTSIGKPGTDAVSRYLSHVRFRCCLPLDSDGVTDLQTSVRVLADGDNVASSFVTTAEVILGLERPIAFGGVQVRLIATWHEFDILTLTRKMTNPTYVAYTRVHDLDQCLSRLQVLGLDDIIVFHRDIAVGLLHKGTSSLLGDRFVGVEGHRLKMDKLKLLVKEWQVRE
jgi:hypothetical protein